MKKKIIYTLLIVLIVMTGGMKTFASEAVQQDATIQGLRAKITELEERISVLEELLLGDGETEEIADESSIVKTKRDDIDVKIYENEYFSVVINYIHLHEIGFTVTNKTDVDFTLMVSDLVLDETNYHSSDSCWEIYSGESGEMLFSSSEVLNLDAEAISGTFIVIDDGGLYGDEQEELPFEKTVIS